MALSSDYELATYSIQSDTLVTKSPEQISLIVIVVKIKLA